MGCLNSHGTSETLPTIHPKLANDSNEQPIQIIKPSINPTDHHTSPSNPNQLQKFIPIQQARKISSDILQNFIIAKTIKQKLSGLAFTSSQLMEVIETILYLIYRLQEREEQAEKQLIQQIVQEMAQISINELKYHKVVAKFKEHLKEKNIRHESLSRIYHSIANAHKKQKIERQQLIVPQCQKSKLYEQIKVTYRQTNYYNALSAQEVEEVVKFQAVGQKIEQFSTRFKFKYDSIRSQSEDINKLLAENFSCYQQSFKKLKYDFDRKEIMKVAQISRNACNYSDNGVVILLIYLVKACSKWQKSGKSVQAIQKVMEECINNISQVYPPGEGLKKEQQNLTEALKGLELKDKYTHKSYTLSAQNKQQSLEKVIMENARTAKNYKNDFEELLLQTCLQLSIKIKMGLKLDPDRPNQKAMIRIKEKMLIAKDQKNQARISKGTVQQSNEFEDEEYKRKVDQLLSTKNDVIFKISDMLRGKCVFISIPDIILTIEKIKAFALKDEKKRYRIIEIESRFTNKVPISDVTLKIAINEEIVTELQLTIQSNAAAYNFAHKVYQLQRAKMFSKIKIVHNYYEEFQGDFKELVIKAVNHAKETLESKDKSLQKQISQKVAIFKEKDGIQKLNVSLPESYFLILRHSKTIKLYFSITDTKTTDFQEVIRQILVNSPQKNLPTKLVISTNSQLQKMMLTIFNKQMGNWGKQLGKQIDSVLISKCSDLLKATLMSFFFRSFDLSKELHTMLQFHPDYMEIASQLKYYKAIGQQFMALYFQKVFGISRPFNLTRATARIYYRISQLYNITLVSTESYPIRLYVRTIFKGVVVEHSTSETVQFFLQIVKAYFIIRDKQNGFYEYFDVFYELLMQMLQEHPELDSGVSSEAKLVRVNRLMQEKKEEGYKQASRILRQIKDDFKKRQELLRWLQCELLLAETTIYDPSTTIESFQIAYMKAQKSATALGLQLKGQTVGNSQWRICEQLWKMDIGQKQKVVIEIHLGKAITQSSRNQGETLFLKMKQAQQRGYAIQKFKIIENYSIRHIKLRNIGLNQSDWKLLLRTKWKNLTFLDLKDKSIGAQGCAYLSKADWKNLASLALQAGNIGSQGCEHLSKADWKNLTSLEIENDNIGAQGCAHLIRADWKNLAYLSLWGSNIGAEGCAYLCKADWKNLTSLRLGNNNIGSQGVAYLIKGNWKNLSIFRSGGDNIGVQGCSYLAKAQWKNLTILDLYNSNIGAQGCAHLIKAEFKNLTTLILDENNIGDEGCAHLSKGKWQNLKRLQLRTNDIGSIGCSHLSKAQWNNLQSLYFMQNKVEEKIRDQVRKLFGSQTLKIKWQL